MVLRLKFCRELEKEDFDFYFVGASSYGRP